jgi:hypothetical protein
MRDSEKQLPHIKYIYGPFLYIPVIQPYSMGEVSDHISRTKEMGCWSAMRTKFTEFLPFLRKYLCIQLRRVCGPQ